MRWAEATPEEKRAEAELAPPVDLSAGFPNLHMEVLDSSLYTFPEAEQSRELVLASPLRAQPSILSSRSLTPGGFEVCTATFDEHSFLRYQHVPSVPLRQAGR